MRTAVILVNYNMPERANALAEHLQENCKVPFDLILVDNGSNLTDPSPYTTIALAENIQTTCGWLMGLNYAKYLEKKNRIPYFAYNFLITSAEPVGDIDYLSRCVEFLKTNPAAVGVHPALSGDSTTAWKHLITRPRENIAARQTWMIDNICSVFRADWFDSIGWFDSDMVYGWGIDQETCLRARRQNRELWILEPAMIKKVTDIGYTMNRMNMEAQTRRSLAYENMADVLGRKYGVEWKDIIMNEGVDTRWL